MLDDRTHAYTFVTHTMLYLSLAAGGVACGDELMLDEEDIGWVDDTSEALSGSGASVYRRKGLVRIDFEGGRMCSGSLIGPNLVLTAAHCLLEGGDMTNGGHKTISTSSNVEWAKVRARIRYNPAGARVRCLNNYCRSNSRTFFANLLAFWPSGYRLRSWCPTHPDHSCYENDIALIGSRSAFRSYSDNQAARQREKPLQTFDFDDNDLVRVGDFLYIAGDRDFPFRQLNFYGFGKLSSTSRSAFDARRGEMSLNTRGSTTVAGYVNTRANPLSICRGDSGGPLIVEHGTKDQLRGRAQDSYIVGVASGLRVRRNHMPPCTDPNTNFFWSTAGRYIGTFINPVLRHLGARECRRHIAVSKSRLTGARRYYSCT